MQVQVCKDYAEMSDRAAVLLKNLIQEKPDCVLGLATGSTPIGAYNLLIEAYKKGELDFSKVTTFNLDEYYPLAPEHDQSYRYFMNSHLFDHVNIDKTKTFVPDGLATDVEASCKAYDALYDSFGGADIQVLGIGQNGHVGFNEPAETLVEGTHLTDLTESTIKANARFFASEADVPKQAVTMGMGTICKAKFIMVMANGEAKADAVDKMINGEATGWCPASMLKDHENVLLLCDEAAYAKAAARNK